MDASEIINNLLKGLSSLTRLYQAFQPPAEQKKIIHYLSKLIDTAKWKIARNFMTVMEDTKVTQQRTEKEYPVILCDELFHQN